MSILPKDRNLEISFKEQFTYLKNILKLQKNQNQSSLLGCVYAWLSVANEKHYFFGYIFYKLSMDFQSIAATQSKRSTNLPILDMILSAPMVNHLKIGKPIACFITSPPIWIYSMNFGQNCFFQKTRHLKYAKRRKRKKKYIFDAKMNKILSYRVIELHLPAKNILFSTIGRLSILTSAFLTSLSLLRNVFQNSSCFE